MVDNIYKVANNPDFSNKLKLHMYQNFNTDFVDGNNKVFDLYFFENTFETNKEVFSEDDIEILHFLQKEKVAYVEINNVW